MNENSTGNNRRTFCTSAEYQGCCFVCLLGFLFPFLALRFSHYRYALMLLFVLSQNTHSIDTSMDGICSFLHHSVCVPQKMKTKILCTCSLFCIEQWETSNARQTFIHMHLLDCRLCTMNASGHLENESMHCTWKQAHQPCNCNCNNWIVCCSFSSSIDVWKKPQAIYFHDKVFTEQLLLIPMTLRSWLT